MIDRFLEYIEIEKRYSRNTVISYRRDLSDFLKFILKTEGHQDLGHVDKKVIRNFMSELTSSGISKRTINRKLSALRSFFGFLLKVGDISVSPVETINSLKFYP